MSKLPGQTLRILHVEDDQDLREITSLALELTGPVVLMQCESGEEAIENVVEFGPDVILLDVVMPTMGGPEVFSYLKKIPEISDVPVVFITARAHEYEINELMTLGALSVIAKPFEPMELLSMIEAAMRLAPNPGTSPGCRTPRDAPE